jgi:Cu(I)/Ag(I) efflux system membrane fusion protein
MKRPTVILIAVPVAIALVALGYVGGRRRSPVEPSPAPAAGPASGAGSKKVLYWYDTMVPQQHFDHPGLSPMGMQMVPRYADANVGSDHGALRISAATLQNLGVRTATVERRVLGAALRVPGTISWDLRQASTISARVDAVIVKLDVRAPYTAVTAGAPLAELLAPQWNSALAEYGALQQAGSSDARALRNAARERLQVLGMTTADIRSAQRGGDRSAITLHAPQAGVVTTLDVREGQRVTAGQTLMTINGLSTVWVEAALPQGVAGTVSATTPVSVSVDALPGRTFKGTVETLLPDVDNATRTQRARIVIENPDGALSPGMFATVQLDPARGEARPVVPDDALIATGSQTRVVLAEANGHFRDVEVKAGRSAGGYTEILAGLGGGEKVVVSGQFLIDSEASLSGALERLGGSAAGTGHREPETGKPASSSAPAAPASAPMSGMPMSGMPMGGKP